MQFSGRQLWLAAAFAGLAFLGFPAHAQKYPTKPIRLIVPFAPGGGTDIIARVMAQKMSEAVGQSVVVDNRPGAGGTIGAEIAAKSAPDGYTMIMVSGSYAVNAGLYKLAYDPVDGIDTVSMVGTSPFIVALHPSVAPRNIKELIALAKARPGTINYGSTGTGGITHMTTELFRLMANINIVHVPYKGTGPALNDLIAGQIQLVFGSILATLPHVKSGRLKGIAVTGPKRTNAAPDLPTVAESGLPGYEVTLWYGVLGPKGLPKNVAGLWQTELVKILQSADMKGRLATEGLEAVGSTPEEFRAHLRREVAKWSKVIKDANVKIGS
ncbi:MAG: tripartite tricarboxylate transporter substrate binding protein [Betaproteobacteria bacterium]|nr:tripartite tricarboxylate transporter substrate binding protein [Betaproteobacteria bacterium]